MRVSESRRKRLDFFDKLRKTLSRWFDKVVDILGKPIDVLDYWAESKWKNYEQGMRDGISAMREVRKNSCDIIIGRCNYIFAIISEMELKYPELHTEVENIEKSVREIREQVR